MYSSTAQIYYFFIKNNIYLVFFHHKRKKSKTLAFEQKNEGDSKKVRPHSYAVNKKPIP
jgi:hypothetical protein